MVEIFTLSVYRSIPNLSFFAANVVCTQYKMGTVLFYHAILGPFSLQWALMPFKMPTFFDVVTELIDVVTDAAHTTPTYCFPAENSHFLCKALTCDAFSLLEIRRFIVSA